MGRALVLAALLCSSGCPNSKALPSHLGAAPAGRHATASPRKPQPENARRFSAELLADMDEVWTGQFKQGGHEYKPPEHQLFENSVVNACGYGYETGGTFYCPGEQTIYISLTATDELERKYPGAGRAVAAYFLAHAMGHHIQNLLGMTANVTRQQARMSEEEGRGLLLRAELQADYYAGVWASSAQTTLGLLGPGELDSALANASAYGEFCTQSPSAPQPFDPLTHGTPELRARWFRKGYDSGDMTQGDAFKARGL
jgi:predicted metalloprotease